jgi:hypothetical protein
MKNVRLIPVPNGTGREDRVNIEPSEKSCVARGGGNTCCVTTFHGGSE